MMVRLFSLFFINKDGENFEGRLWFWTGIHWRRERDRAFVVGFWLQWMKTTGSGGSRRGKYSAL